MSGARFAGIRRVLRIPDVERDVEAELAFHFERAIEELVAAGMTEREAREEAHRRFGDERRYRRELERMDRRSAALRRWRERLGALGEDVAYAVRRMRLSPGPTLGVVLTFALGIGANATMFGVLDRLLLRPPAHVVDAEAVQRVAVNVAFRDGQPRDVQPWMSFPDYLDITSVGSYSAVAAYSDNRIVVGRGEAARPMSAELATGGYFTLLGVRPHLGRFFGPEDDRPHGAGVAVIGYERWRADFGGDPAVLGHTIDFGHGPYEIIGVAPKGFTGVNLGAVDYWLPLETAGTAIRGDGWRERRTWHWMRVVARLAPGVTPERAASEATVLHRIGRQEMIDGGRYDAGAEIVALPLITARGPLASQESVVAKWLAGVSLLVLLIACANVANLLLARALRQRRDFGIRLALGISRGRLLSQVMVESLLLSVFGGIAALLVTRWAGAFVRGVLLPDVAWPDSPVAGRVALFSVGLCLLAGLVAGILPGVQASRPDVVGSLKAGSRTIARPGSRTRDTLTVLQAALSVVLLAGAGLFVRSLRGAESVDLGFEAEGVVLAEPIYEGKPTDEEGKAFYRRAVERLPALPGVERAAESFSVPFWSVNGVGLSVPGLDSIPRNATGGMPLVHAVGSDYFATMRLRVLKGRGFSPEDREGAARVAVVNQSMARRFWPAGDALGQCLVIDSLPCAEVVGVVEDAAIMRVGETGTMQYYVPFSQGPFDGAPEALLVRIAGDLDTMILAVRRELLALDPRVRFVETRTFAELIDPQARAWRLGATMFTLFGVLALVVAAIGLYSVLAFAVAQRFQELGIRSALGAGRRDLVRLVLGHGLRLVAFGLALGLAAVLLAGPYIEPLLFRTSPRDPLTLTLVPAALLAVACAASALPALRATRVDPNTALRAE